VPVIAHLPQPSAVETTRVIPVAAFLRDDGTPLREGDILLWVSAPAGRST